MSTSIQSLRPHLYYEQSVQEQHHNFQEGMMPLHFLESVWTEQLVPPGQLNRPESFMALLDNITIVSLINKLRTRSLPLASAFAPNVVLWHQRGWQIRAMHIDKETMDTQFSVDQIGRQHSKRWHRGLPTELFMELLLHLSDLTQQELLQERWVDLFTTYTI